jgi:hypothetical protein
MRPLYPILSTSWSVDGRAMQPLKPLSLLVAPLVALAAAPAAHAATIINLKPCYVSVDRNSRENLKGVFAVGFDRTAELDVAIGSDTSDAVATSDGTLDLSGSAAPFQRRGEAPFTVKVTEPNNPVNTAVATSRVTDLSVRVRPREAQTSDRVRFRGRGFTAPRPVWGHYVLNGRLRKTVRFARRPAGPCGHFSARRRQIPIDHPRAGRWTLQVDQQHHWSSRPATVWFRVTIVVRHAVGA